MRYWVKLHTEIVDDAKIARLNDRQFRLCINLFAVAGIEDKDGKVASDIKELAWRLRLQVKKLSDDLAVLIRENIVAKRPDGIFLVHFSTRNPKYESDTKQARRERTARHRAKKAESDPGNDSVTTLHAECNDSVTTDRKEENRKEESREELRSSAGAEERPVQAPTRREILKMLQEHFAEQSGLPIPPYKSESQKRAVSKRWWEPLWEIYEYGHDPPAAKRLIGDSIQHMRRDKLTIAAPASIVNVARHLYGEQHAKRNGSATANRNGVVSQEEWDRAQAELARERGADSGVESRERGPGP